MRTTNARLDPTAAIILALMLSACGPDADDPSSSAEPAPPGAGLTAEELATEPPARARPPVEDLVAIGEQHPGEVTELEWDALIPEDWRPATLLEGLSADGADLDDIEDDDPRADLVWNKLRDLWKQAPVVEALDGKRVKLPGFVVPLEFDLDDVREFLLVPYYGACIHVPPPPANQTVYVVLPEGKTYRGGLFDTVWVTGELRIERFESDMANAGYRIEALAIAPYR